VVKKAQMNLYVKGVKKFKLPAFMSVNTVIVTY